MTARVTDPVKDRNGDKCALIKVVTTESGFGWEGGMLGIMKADKKKGEYWVYVPYGAKKLTIKHDKLGVLRNYLYPEPIEKATVYEMVLTTGSVKTIVTDVAVQKQWLVIKSNPPGATVYLNDEIQSLLTPFTKKLDLGKYSYRLEYADYYNAGGFVELTADKKTQLDIELKAAFGQLQINSQPENGAVAVIDGKPTGKRTPCTIEHIASGTHTIRLMKDMYNVVEQDFMINDGLTTTLNINLKADFGQLQISGEGTDIYVDGEYKAKNIWNGRLSPGIHSLEGKKDKHHSDIQSFELIAGEDKSFTINPLPRTGNVDVMSTPIEATIRIDGNNYGATPNTVRDLLIGDHSLQLSKTGYGTIDKTITITENQIIEINEELPSGKEITINSDPAGAVLTIDGQSYGTTPWTGTLAFGSHEIKLINGKKTINEQITISQNGKSSFSYDVRIDNDITVNKGGGGTWNPVTNPATGQTWMDRNLGASRVATSSTDARAYGDLYQWGRGTDGHEKRNSGTTSTLSNSDTPGHGNFITVSNSPYDWRSPKNNNLWQGVNGTNNPCPSGYRLPTRAEWEAERQSWSSKNAAGAFNSPLKLPVAGGRNFSSGSLGSVGSSGGYWSATVDGPGARLLTFYSSNAYMYNYFRADGSSVRCLKD